MSEIIVYTTPTGNIKIEIRVQGETVWLTQQKIADLFGVDRTVITKHLRNIFSTGELEEAVVCANFAHTTQHGAIKGKRQISRVKYYNLDAIISVGYRVNSAKATQFRIWATKALGEYLIKGFVMDDERLKQGTRLFGKDYFKELLERVRSIRASERRVYQQITDIFAECSTDYDPNSKITQNFYASVQNKFHYAITGKTAAEIIYHKADSKRQNMGLTTWKDAPRGRMLKQDAKIAKNYLSEREIKRLERTVSGYFDYIENHIENRNTFTMAQLAESVNKFLEFNEYKILEGLGKVSHDKAMDKASAAYDAFNKTQKIISDFDQFSKKITPSKHE